MATLNQPDAQKSPLSNTFQHSSTTVCSAYNLCRRAEQNILTDLKSSSHTKAARAPLEAQLVYVRLLGHLIAEGPGDTTAAHIATSIVSAKDNEELFHLGRFYLEHFIRTFRKAKGRTPEASQHQSRISFNKRRDKVEEELTTSPMNHQQAKRSALARDSSRCVISGSVDFWVSMRNDELGREPFDLSAGFGGTQCCHIMPEFTNTDIDDPSNRAYAANAWTILKYFGYTDIHLELAGTKVHSLENILTMDTFLHSLFDELLLWLEATPIPHRYKVCTSQPGYVFSSRKLPRFVTFSSASPELKLPSPKYLGLHAACCRVAHMSGAAGYLDMLDDMDDNFDSGASDEKFAGDLVAKLYSIQGTMEQCIRIPT